MEFQKIKVSELIEFVNSEFYKNSDVIPISPQRAISQAYNPDADQEDIALILAVESGIMMGYIGIIPGYIHYDNRNEKAHWLSCWWVSAIYRGKGLGPDLLTMAIRTYPNIMVTQFATGTEKVYLKTKLVDIPVSLKGKKAVLRFNFHDVISEKKPGLKFLIPLAKGFDWFFNVFQDLRLKAWQQFYPLTSKINYPDKIDAQTKVFIEKDSSAELFRRSPASLEWILKYKWVLPEKINPEINKKYYFSSGARRFSFYPVKVLDNKNELIGFMVLQLKNNTMKVPYLYFVRGNGSKIMEVITHEMIRLKASMITLYNEELGQEINNYPFLFIKDSLRPYFFSRNLCGIDFKKYRIQDGDGDCAFT